MGILEEARDRVMLAEQGGLQPLALVVSPDIMSDIRLEAANVYYVQRAPEVKPPTFMSLPIEVVDEARNHLSVRCGNPQ